MVAQVARRKCWTPEPHVPLIVVGMTSEAQLTVLPVLNRVINPGTFVGKVPNCAGVVTNPVEQG